MKTCRSFVIGYVLCGLVVVAVVVVWKESSYIAKTRLYLTVTQAVLEFLLIYLYLLRTGTLYFLLIFFLKDGVLCSPGWSQIPCSWRWPELLTLLISLLQCWVCGYELPFLPVPRCIRVQFKRSFGHLKQGGLHTNCIAISLNELAVSVVLLWMVFLCNNFCLYKRDGLSTSYF